MAQPLEIRDLRKSYSRKGRKPLEAVAGISFNVTAGECFGLLGPNGAGKSTSMKCITGFYPPTAGTVHIQGINVHESPKVARMQLGVCAQEDTLDTDFTVFDQMVQFARYFGIAKKDARYRADELLSRFGLAGKRNELVEALSGGMRRRLQVARALVNSPRVLVLDEPTTGLDPEARRVLWEILVQERRNGLAILLSTHYMEEAERLCDRVGIIHSGKILAIASPEELIAREIGSRMIREEIRPGVPLERVPNLEDVYLKLTGATLDSSNSDDSGASEDHE